jgi:dTDP-4-dehydrorhamnose reductase
VKLLVFGKSGQVARELQRRVPAGTELICVDRASADLSKPQDCARIIHETKAELVVNAAAWTAVDAAETHAAEAMVINADAPAAMARAAADRGLPFVHLSTDYVFDGAGDAPFLPESPTAPLGVYGQTKRAGEVAVMQAGGRFAILRTSWVISAHGSNFVKTMRRLGAERDALSVVADQIGGPTPAAAIADAVFTVAQALREGAAGGVYHFAGAPDASWADLARAVMAGSGLPCQIHEISTAEYPTPARRPLNSRLDCSSLQADFGIPRPDWRQGLAQILSELAG